MEMGWNWFSAQRSAPSAPRTGGQHASAQHTRTHISAVAHGDELELVQRRGLEEPVGVVEEVRVCRGGQGGGRCVTLLIGTRWYCGQERWRPVARPVVLLRRRLR